MLVEWIYEWIFTVKFRHLPNQTLHCFLVFHTCRKTLKERG